MISSKYLLSRLKSLFMVYGSELSLLGRFLTPNVGFVVISHRVTERPQNLAFHDNLKPLGTIVAKTKFFHLGSPDMKSEVSGPL